MTPNELNHLFDEIKKLQVVVIGDVMIDSYWWGTVERISPEAPVPIVNITHKETRLGGAANVALNCVKLGAKVSLASVCGQDIYGDLIETLCNQHNIDTQLLIKTHTRQTTCKTRVLSKHQQIVRIDDEQTSEIEPKIEHDFIDKVLRMLQIKKPQVVIFEDYNKGVLKANVINKIIKHCNNLGIITFVDPKKQNFFEYKHVTVFKPNLKELQEGLNKTIGKNKEQELLNAHIELKKKLNHDITFITLSESGVFVAQKEDEYKQSPAHIRNIADVSGAGDTTIATAALIYTVSNDIFLMSNIANIAGGLVCEQVGVKPIDANLLLQECSKIFVQK